MGRHATATKREREISGSEDKGPTSKAKSKSLKFESHARKNPVVALKCTEEKLRGMKMLKQTMGRRKTSLVIPAGMNFRIQ